MSKQNPINVKRIPRAVEVQAAKAAHTDIDPSIRMAISSVQRQVSALQSYINDMLQAHAMSPNTEGYSTVNTTTSKLTNKSGAARNNGEVVVKYTSSDSAFTTTTTLGDIDVLGVVYQDSPDGVSDAIAVDADGLICTSGLANIKVDGDAAAITQGDYLRTYTTAGVAAKADYLTDDGVFAVALEDKVSGVGNIYAIILGRPSHQLFVQETLTADDASTVTLSRTPQSDPSGVGACVMVYDIAAGEYTYPAGLQSSFAGHKRATITAAGAVVTNSLGDWGTGADNLIAIYVPNDREHTMDTRAVFAAHILQTGFSGQGAPSDTFTSFLTQTKTIEGAINALQGQLTAQNEPNGFVDKDDSTISFDNATRKFTINPVASDFEIYQTGTLTIVSTSDVVGSNYTIIGTGVVGDEGLWAIYYDGGILASIQNPTTDQVDDIILNKVFVAYVYWDATNNLSQIYDERHGTIMDGKTHQYLHNIVGLAYSSGLAIGDVVADGNGNDNASAQFSVGSGVCFDEDLIINLNAIAKTTGLEIWYIDGSDWRWTTNAGYSVWDGGLGGRLAWNDSGTQTEVGNANFVLCHVFATNLTSGDVIAIQGQAEYSTISQARDGAEIEISNLVLAGLPMPEMKPIASIIYQTSSAYSNAVKARIRTTNDSDDYVDWRTNPLSQSYTAQDHGALAGLQDNDHPQYLLRKDYSTIMLMMGA